MITALLSAALLPGPANHPAAQVAQALLDTIESKDVAAAKALFLEGATIKSLTYGSDGPAPYRLTTVDDWAAGIETSNAELFEGMRFEHVIVTPGMAIVAGPYTFTVNGTLSHCGVNTLTLLSVEGLDVEGGWRIADVTYTATRLCDDEGYPSPAAD